MRKVLFLCIGNSCRSQMAEGWLRHLAPDRFEAHSAGVMPCYVNEDAIRVMSEVGIDISQQRSKHVSEYDGQHFPFVITVCDPARTSCPVFAGETHREHWPVEDPGMSPARTSTASLFSGRLETKLASGCVGSSKSPDAEAICARSFAQDY